MRTTKKSTEEIAYLIARAFLHQRYPLSELGMELKKEAQSFLAAGSIPAKYVDILPTVENPRLELFADFDLTPEQEVEVFGWGLSCVQSHKGCTHQCKQCYRDAACRLEMTPFAAIAKIAEKKWKYEKLGCQEWKDWEEHLRKAKIVDFKKFRVRKFVNTARKNELIGFFNLLLAEWEKFPRKVLKLRVPFEESLPLNALRGRYLHFVPINLGSIINCVSNYEDNDPLEYRDFRFLHQDGTPADYGDVFRLMSTCIRPVTVTTAGWFSEDKIACRAMKKVVEICAENHLVDSKRHRISVSTGERHFRKDSRLYVSEIERMISEAASLNPLVNLYYDKGDDEDRRIVEMMAILFSGLMEKKLGIKSNILLTPISFRTGRAVELRKGDDYENWDPDANIDGIHIRVNGEVKKKPDFEWGSRRNKEGKLYYFPRTPEDSVPEPTGMRLYHLAD